jgi:Protein-L-isoaspartate(D-aspartate) O-methyltransferase (PCMT)
VSTPKTERLAQHHPIPISNIGPYNAIHVGAAAPTMPTALVDQLASPGRMFIPVGTHQQHVWQVDKDANGTVSKSLLMSVRVSLLNFKVEPYLMARSSTCHWLTVLARRIKQKVNGFNLMYQSVSSIFQWQFSTKQLLPEPDVSTNFHLPRL